MDRVQVISGCDPSDSSGEDDPPFPMSQNGICMPRPERSAVASIVFAHTDVTPLVGPPYWITASGLYPLLPCKLAMFSNQFINLKNGILPWDFDYFIETFSFCIFNENKEEYNVKT